MEALRQWAICLIIAAFAGAFVTVISPRGSMDKTVRAVAGVFVVAALCSPLAQLEDFEFSFEEEDITYDENSFLPEAGEKLAEIYANTVADRVNEIASEAGTKTESVDADVSVDENGCIIIHKISVGISEPESAETLEKMLSEKLGVPVTVEVK